MQTTPPTNNLFFNDVFVGQCWTTESTTLSESDIINFARQFDPQPFHLDVEAARRSAFGGLVASGLHTLSLSLRLFFDLNLWENAIIASPGMQEVRWIKPVRPGDVLCSEIEVTEVRLSRSKPDRGVVTTSHRTTNANSELVFSAVSWHLLRVKP